MNTRNLFTAIALTALFTTTGYAAQHPATEQFKVQPSTIYQAIHGQALADTLAHIAQRSGIVFKINTDLSKDIITRSIAADNWNAAIKALLVDYNFTAIQEGENFKTVIISGHKNDAPATVIAKSITADSVLVVEPKFGKLPAKYAGFPAGAVTAVNLPIDSMMSIKNKSVVNLDLPMGQFNVAHDYTVNEQDGSQTWVGYLAQEGQGYRVFMSKGAAGVMGMVTTPDGTYNIESDKNTVYLLDTNKLQHAGYDGDSVVPTAQMLTAIAANATNSQVDLLQSAVTSAKALLDSAQAQVQKDNDLVTSFAGSLKTAQSNLTAENVKLNSLLTDFSAAPGNLENAKNSYALAIYNYQKAVNNTNVANRNLTDANAAAATALANYNQAVNALAAAQAPSTVVSTPTATTVTDPSVVDLMVVYTTGAQTQAYALQRISLLVTASNQAYVDSHINMKLRLVHTEPTTYVENNSNFQALQDFSNGNDVFANIDQTRTQYGADLVFLFRPLYARVAGSCGTTYVEFANGSDANAALGYGTIGDGNAVDAPGYYCAGNTFTHEIGHTLGLVHDREFTNVSGVFDYSYAWGVQGTFGTIMSYKTPVLMYFSTPKLQNQCAGQVCGYPSTNTAKSSDQASSVNYTAPIIANFLPTTIAIPVLN
ncbi:reprolysin-like metallopeptidase [Methylomonas sp. AM2-LC]|uniref:reprolysin-like metallopeptidase n=1 Tax=Methylomonas sp. AM2-LC TaxID=3153301 RepID=UPI003267E6E7